MLNLLLVLTCCTFFFSALFTPTVFSLLCYIFPNFDYPFSRVFDRVAMIILAIMVLMYHKDFKFAAFKGYVSFDNYFLKCFRFFFGIVLTFCSVCLAVLWANSHEKIIMYSDFLTLKLALSMVGVFFVAILISVLEEGFFRVLLFDRLQKRFNVFYSAVISSLIYGALHFISPVKSFVYEDFNLFAGFEYLYHVICRLFQPGLLAPYFGMVMIGLLLCYTMYKTKSFALCVGIHSGFVMGMKFIKQTAFVNPEISIPSGAGKQYFIVGQPEAWASFALIFIILFLTFRSFKSFSRDERVKA